MQTFGETKRLHWRMHNFRGAPGFRGAQGASLFIQKRETLVCFAMKVEVSDAKRKATAANQVAAVPRGGEPG
jgi:hypothetical protein